MPRLSGFLADALVQLERETLNSLLDTLEEWETALKACNFDPNTVTQDNDPRCGDEHNSE
jgi:hypothetical protein